MVQLNKKQDLFLILFTLTIASLLFTLFSYLLKNQFGDLDDHFKNAHNISTGAQQLPSNFLMYALVAMFKNYNYQKITFLFILVLGLVLKFILSFFYFQFHSDSKKFYRNVIFATSMIILIPIPLPKVIPLLKEEIPFYYLHYFTPNIWHNTTTILLVPFAMLLFYHLFEKSEEGLNKRNVLELNVKIILLIMLNLAIKPSFMFSVVVLLTLRIFVGILFQSNYFNFQRKYIFYLIISFFLILSQYLITYYLNIGSLEKEKSEIVISFFRNLEIKEIAFIPFAFLCSFLFPILFLSFKGLKNIENSEFTALLLVVISIIIFFSLNESGPRELHKNFYWQIVPCSSILFIVTVNNYLKNSAKFTSVKKYILISVLALHFISGLFYLNKIICEFDFT
jgi:hypothetical protein